MWWRPCKSRASVQFKLKGFEHFWGPLLCPLVTTLQSGSFSINYAIGCNLSIWRRSPLECPLLLIFNAATFQYEKLMTCRYWKPRHKTQASSDPIGSSACFHFFLPISMALIFTAPYLSVPPSPEGQCHLVKQIF